MGSWPFLYPPDPTQEAIAYHNYPHSSPQTSSPNLLLSLAPRPQTPPPSQSKFTPHEPQRRLPLLLLDKITHPIPPTRTRLRRALHTTLRQPQLLRPLLQLSLHIRPVRLLTRPRCARRRRRRFDAGSRRLAVALELGFFLCALGVECFLRRGAAGATDEQVEVERGDVLGAGDPLEV